jgi:hypothetical protein
MSRRRLLARIAPPVVLLAAGAIVATAWDGAVAVGVSSFLLGSGVVVAMALAFFEIGLSEDRDRAREEAARRRRGPRWPR